MAVNRRTLIGAGVLGASAVATTGVLLFRERPEVRGALGDVTHLRGYAGGEKMAFLANPKTLAALKAKGLAMDAERAGSVEQVRDRALLATRPQFLWPSSSPLVELAKQNAKVLADQVIFNSPIVIYSWAPIAEGFVKAGFARREGQHYYVDAKALIEAVLARRPWKDLGQPDLYGRVRMTSTDPNKSNSGFMFAGLAANLLHGDVVDSAALPSVMPQVVDLFHGMGFKSASSGKAFEDYIAGGPGAQPLVVGYENQLVEWMLEDRKRWARISAAAGPAKPVALYPTPTVFSAHPLLVLDKAAAPLVPALTSPPLQTIAWRDHGFRGPLGAIGAETDALVRDRMPGQIAQVVPMPDMGVMLALLQALA